MDFLKPFVLPVEARTPERHETLDIYPPDDIAGPRPAILFVPGGPTPAQVRPEQRDWPVYRGYGALAASRGAVGAVVDHQLHTPLAYAVGAARVEAALESLRSDERVDEGRLALWFFSGGSLLAADWLREPPSWLRVLALSYPLLAPMPGWRVEGRFDPIGAAARAVALPIVLTRAGREDVGVAGTVEAFVAEAGKAELEIVDVPEGHHAFDVVDDSEESRGAVNRAMDLVLAKLA
ncbi:alpha/beta hydrolase [Actinoplanes oblitus]|uniref:Alpha/beta hydrolase n=1 Tax=Actinoplanes oblitus TaxID=3040509 RepID=A0ABY8WQR3_9ACTN|nr:alpha/beta hydrolase [Actinoplanes oblitus]WIM98654.1 alpha/beta hydrolase [Actinoplanes oblitus]